MHAPKGKRLIDACQLQSDGSGHWGDRSCHLQAINLHYAQKHGYEYIMFCETNGTSVDSPWLKVAAMEWLAQRAMARGIPTYILILDSDAFVRAIDTRLEDWFDTNGVSFPSASWSMMLSGENKVGTFDPAVVGTSNHLNSGVLYGYVDPAQRDRAERFLAMLRLWQSASCSEALCLKFAKTHPWEQGCLEKLMYDETLRASALSTTELQLLQLAVNVSQQPMNVWNGPWGVFVRHVWGGPGMDKRFDYFTDMVDSYDIDVPKSLASIKAGMLGPPLSLTRPCDGQSEASRAGRAATRSPLRDSDHRTHYS